MAPLPFHSAFPCQVDEEILGCPKVSQVLLDRGNVTFDVQSVPAEDDFIWFHALSLQSFLELDRHGVASCHCIQSRTALLRGGEEVGMNG